MSEVCTVCGKPRAHSMREKAHWLSRIGYGVAVTAILSPIVVLLGSLIPITTRAHPRPKVHRMCQVCEWTFGAFAVAVLLVVAGIVYLIVSTPHA